jgi:hypothetical protein
MNQTIYVALLDEGVLCWRPAEAKHQHDDVYLLTGSNLYPDDERWEFAQGECVRCRLHLFSEGQTELVAFEKAE